MARQWRVDAYEGPYLRCAVNTGGRGKLLAVPLARKDRSQSINTAVAYEVDLEGGEEHTIYVPVPFVTFGDEQEWERVAALDFGDKLEDVTSYWTSYVGSGGVFEIPNTHHRFGSCRDQPRARWASTRLSRRGSRSRAGR